MAESQVVVLKAMVHLFLLLTTTVHVAATTWCVARSEAGEEALQTAMDYACGSGADCAPIQANGLCYLPNTVQAHASYAFNSYYQRRGNAPDSCSFAGTATIARTDPSYGSCVYPPSPSTAGGTVGQGGTPVGTSTPGTGTTTPTITAPLPPGAGSTPLYGGPVLPESPRPNASPDSLSPSSLTLLFVFLFIFQTM